jgi:hypothetical protein
MSECPGQAKTLGLGAEGLRRLFDDSPCTFSGMSNFVIPWRALPTSVAPNPAAVAAAGTGSRSGERKRTQGEHLLSQICLGGLGPVPTANCKQQTANSKQQTANSKQQTANSKQQTANSKQQTASSGAVCSCARRMSLRLLLPVRSPELMNKRAWSVVAAHGMGRALIGTAPVGSSPYVCAR